jgi:hypothetical protein
MGHHSTDHSEKTPQGKVMIEDCAVFTKNGLDLQAVLIKIYPNGKKLFFLQDRILVTDSQNRELESKDCFEIFPLYLCF